MNEPLIGEIRTQAVNSIFMALRGLHVEGDIARGPMGNVVQDGLDSLVQRFHLIDPADHVKYEYITDITVTVSRRPA